MAISRKKIITAFLFLTFLIFLSSICHADFYSDYEAKDFLKKIGFSSFIQNADILIITPGQIEGKGGITVDLPILGFVNKHQIYILDNCAEGTVYENGTIVIKANLLHISCVYGIVNGRTHLIVGRDLKHIANKINQR